MPVIGARGRVKPKVSKNDGNISDQVAKSAVDLYVEELDAKYNVEELDAKYNVEELDAKYKNQSEVKQAVNEAQQIADTLKQSKQTAKTDNSYGEEVKTVKFPPLVYVQNHIPKETNYETNYGSGESTTNNYVALALLAVCVILGFMLFVKFVKFVQWIKRKLKQCFKRS